MNSNSDFCPKCNIKPCQCAEESKQLYRALERGSYGAFQIEIMWSLEDAKRYIDCIIASSKEGQAASTP